MSISGVETFLELAKTDEKFKQNIIKTIKALQIKEGKSFNEGQLIKNVIIPLAQKKGINFTEKDFLNYADKKTSKLHEEDLPMVSGGIDKTGKAKLLLGVTLLGSSTAAAMNLAQLRHEEPISSINESSQNESSKNNSHSNRNQIISQENLPNTEEMAKRIGEEPSRAKLEQGLENKSIENLAESANNINDAGTTGQNITPVVTSKKRIEPLQRKEVVFPNNEETASLTLVATSNAGGVTEIKSLVPGYKKETAANAAESEKKVKFAPINFDVSKNAVIQNNGDSKTNTTSNDASKGTTTFQQKIGNANQDNVITTSSAINQNKDSISSVQRAENDVITAAKQSVDRKDTNPAKHEYIHPENWDDMSEDQKFAYLSNFINEIDSNFDQIAEKTRHIFEDDINKVSKDNYYELNHEIRINAPGHKVAGYELYKVMHFFYRNISPQKNSVFLQILKKCL